MLKYCLDLMKLKKMEAEHNAMLEGTELLEKYLSGEIVMTKTIKRKIIKVFKLIAKDCDDDVDKEIARRFISIFKNKEEGKLYEPIE